MNDNNGLTNTQLVMITDIKHRIEALQKEGKDYPVLRQVILDEFLEPNYWCITNKREREMAVGAALLAYAMNDEQRDAVKNFKEETGMFIL